MFGAHWTTQFAVVAALLSVSPPLLVGGSPSNHRVSGAGGGQPNGSPQDAMILRVEVERKEFGGGLMKISAMRSSTVAVLAIPILVAAQHEPVPTTSSADTFRQMKSLIGEWEAIQEGVPVRETYTETANGSVLMAETRSANEPAMITMFTVDGDHLIATHYCIAGNQPQMVTDVPEDLQKGLTFTLARVTGMKTPDDWHNTGITMKLDDPNHMTQRWTYLYKGKMGTTVFHYTRKK